MCAFPPRSCRIFGLALFLYSAIDHRNGVAANAAAPSTPAPPTSPTATPPATPSGKPAALSASQVLQAMIIVEGERGRGSAFVVKMDDRLFVVTNSHVVQGSEKLVFKTLDNQELKLGPLEIADAADLVRAELKENRPALTILPQAEQKLKIGDAVVVAGNAEGAGVVREIPGKVVGIGPDRLEINATFVPGNSGSPILLKSTQQVVGVATYMHVPYFFRKSSGTDVAADQPITSLNEVRRFGYRLDTVAKWLAPAAPNGIAQQGIKLAAMEELDDAVMAIANAGTAELVEGGAARFMRDEGKSKKDAHLTSLAATIDAFVLNYSKGKKPEERKAPFEKLIADLKATSTADVKGYGPERFSGYYAKQYEERIEWRKGLRDWLDSVQRRAEKNEWVISSPWMRRSAPVVDFSKLQLTLAERLDPSATPDKRHRVFYPENAKPASVENIYWVVQNPGREANAYPLHLASLRLTTPVNGLYHVSVEYRAGDIQRKISNVLEINVADIPQPNVEIDFTKAKAPAIEEGEKPSLPDWQKLDRLIAAEAFAKTPILGHDAQAGVIKDLPPDGAVLVGFECNLRPFRESTEIVHGLKPIFLTKAGPVDGSVWGAKEAETTFRIMAKPGYAVGKLSGRYDDVAVRRIKVRFDRIYGLKLNPKDSYETDWIGESTAAKEGSLETNGHLPVGLSGKSGGGLDGLRLVCLADENPNTAVAPPPAGASVPATFASLDEILRAAPASTLARLDDPRTRDEAVKQINSFLAANVQGKGLAMRITVEDAEPIDESGNRFRIKLPDGRTSASKALGTKVWVYFAGDDAPKGTVSIGSKMNISGTIGRCDITSEGNLALHIDVQKASVAK